MPRHTPSILELAFQERLPKDHALEQFLMQPCDVISQADSLLNYIQLFKLGRIALIGDGDHISVALKYREPGLDVAVLELDVRVRKSIDEISLELGIPNPTLIEYDLRDPIPRHIGSDFDFFYVNPPYSKKHPTDKGLSIQVWLQRAWELCGPNKLGIVAMPWEKAIGSDGWEKEVKDSVQKFLRTHSFSQLCVETNCAAYPTAHDKGLKSANLLIRTPPKAADLGSRIEQIYN